MMTQLATSLITPMVSSLIQSVASSLLNAISRKEVTRAGKGKWNCSVISVTFNN